MQAIKQEVSPMKMEQFRKEYVRLLIRLNSLKKTMTEISEEKNDPWMLPHVCLKAKLAVIKDNELRDESYTLQSV